jgi:hypothetical protein
MKILTAEPEVARAKPSSGVYVSPSMMYNDIEVSYDLLGYRALFGRFSSLRVTTLNRGELTPPFNHR